jgi:predicted aldo/keto reductase-like oxidoreductase
MRISTISGKPACPLALAAYPEQDPRCVEKGFHSGTNLFFFYNLGLKPFVEALKTLADKHREDIILASGSGSRSTGGLRAIRRKLVASLGTEVIDMFFAEYLHPGESSEAIFDSGGVLDELLRWKSKGYVRFVGATTHDRTIARRLANDPRVDLLMHRFNMAHRKAAAEVFPSAVATQTPVVAFTATRWGTLLKPNAGWSEKPPTAADCYRYCLAEPAVEIVLTAPKSIRELDENLAALQLPSMTANTRRHWERFGDIVYESGGGSADAYEARWP